MYKLTSCKCGAPIYAEGCCGSEVVITFSCACGEKYLETINNKSKRKVKTKDKKKNE